MSLLKPGDRKFEVDGTGGTLLDITSICRAFTAPEIEEIVDDVTGPGHTSIQQRASGFKQYSPVVFRVDEDSGGTIDAMREWGRDKIGDTRTVKVTYGASEYVSVEAIVQKCKPITDPKKPTEIEVTLLPFGTMTFSA